MVAALAQWHEAHDRARRAARGQSVPAHALVESYAVLTRLPLPRRLDPGAARALLATWFPAGKVLTPDGDGLARILVRIAEAGVAGGGTYDALVALTAGQHDAELLTRDRRAEPTYRRLGVRYRYLE